MTFSMWSPFHYLFILSPFVFAVLLHLLTRNLSPQKRRRVGVGLSLLCILILLLRNGEILVKNDWRWNEELIPLQICHFANFVLLFAFWKNSRVWFALAYCLNLPAALMSILFANSLENYSTILTFRGMAYLFGHMLIVGLTLWALLNRFVRITPRVFGKTLILMSGLYAGGWVVDNLFNGLFGWNANYFYALEPESGTPLELFFEWGTTWRFGSWELNPLYLLLTMLTGLAVVSLFYGLYKAVGPRIFPKGNLLP